MVPWAIPGYVSILLWKTGMFNSQFGLLNQWMERLGLQAVRWLANDVSAFLCCTVVNLWLALPFMIMIMDGALQAVDKSYYESAILDGATWLQRAVHITIPEIRGIIGPGCPDHPVHHLQTVRCSLSAYPAGRSPYRRQHPHHPDLRTRKRLYYQQLRIQLGGVHDYLRRADPLLNRGEQTQKGGLIHDDAPTRRTRRALAHLLLHLLFLAICFATLVPILYAVSVSLNADNSLLSSNFRFIPEQFTLRNYQAVFTQEPVMLWLGNTLILALATVAICLAVSVPAAYVFSRMRFKGRRPVLRLLILLYSFPSVLSMFAIYRLLSPLGLVNTHLGLILIYTGTMAEFGLLNMKGYFDTIPVEIEEAASIDGASRAQIVLRVVLPLAQPSILVTAVQVLIYVWNEYLFATTFMTGAEHYTLAAGLYSLQATEISGSWPVFAAASLVVSLPILVVFFAIQRHMTSGLTAGGVKG